MESSNHENPFLTNSITEKRPYSGSEEKKTDEIDNYMAFDTNKSGNDG